MHALLTCLLVGLTAEPSPSLINRPDSPLQVSAQAELGFLGVLRHTIQYGRAGSRIDYVREGGQDVLAPFARLSADVNLVNNHTITLLYQPLDIQTQVETPRALTIDGGTFAAGRAVDMHYGFSFWRATYLYELFGRGDNELGLGGGLQLRNAVIDFTDSAAGLRRSERNIGPVPLLKARGRMAFTPALWGAVEVDGFWAPIKFINGSDVDVNGAIWDISARLGTELLQRASVYLNLRYLGGGASGTSPRTGQTDGFSDNWLHFLIVSVGAELR